MPKGLRVQKSGIGIERAHHALDRLTREFVARHRVRIDVVLVEQHHHLAHLRRRARRLAIRPQAPGLHHVHDAKRHEVARDHAETDADNPFKHAPHCAHAPGLVNMPSPRCGRKWRHRVIPRRTPISIRRRSSIRMPCTARPLRCDAELRRKRRVLLAQHYQYSWWKVRPTQRAAPETIPPAYVWP